MLSRTWSALALVAVVAACATTPFGWPAGVRSTPLGRGSYRGYTNLEVNNRSAEDVRVYVVRFGTWIYVGTVGSLSVRGFALSPAETGAFGTMTLAAETLGSRQQHEGELLDFQPGQTVEWRIEDGPALSTLQPIVVIRR